MLVLKWWLLTRFLYRNTDRGYTKRVSKQNHAYFKVPQSYARPQYPAFQSIRCQLDCGVGYMHRKSVCSELCNDAAPPYLSWQSKSKARVVSRCCSHGCSLHNSICSKGKNIALSTGSCVLSTQSHLVKLSMVALVGLHGGRCHAHHEAESQPQSICQSLQKFSYPWLGKRQCRKQRHRNYIMWKYDFFHVFPPKP